MDVCLEVMCALRADDGANLGFRPVKSWLIIAVMQLLAVDGSNTKICKVVRLSTASCKNICSHYMTPPVRQLWSINTRWLPWNEPALTWGKNTISHSPMDYSSAHSAGGFLTSFFSQHHQTADNIPALLLPFHNSSANGSDSKSGGIYFKSSWVTSRW